MAPGGGHRRMSLMFFVFFFTCYYQVSASQILGILPTDSHAYHSPNSGAVKIEGETDVALILVGTGIEKDTYIFFTPNDASCLNVEKTKPFRLKANDRGTSAEVTIHIRQLEDPSALYYVCAYDNSTQTFMHAGTESWVSISVFESPDEEGTLLPLWLQIIIITVLLVLSGLFSGLNLGLMSLDQTELTIIEKVGSENEKKYARRIGPLRARGNLLLCTLLLGNVMVNSTFTILFDNLTNGIIAILSSTVGIVIFGEIIPQAICSRHGLAVGAKTYWLTRFFMVVTFPASYPISVILDKILGEEMGQVYSKEKLQELIRMTADKRLLHDNEANIISGALQLTNKSVEDIMTKIEDVYMLEIGTVLDFDTLSEILRHGYTRVPVHDGEKTNIVNLLNTKDLALIDPDDNTLLSTVCKYYDHKPLLVDYDAKLDTMLQEFLQGNSHMAIVQKLHNREDRDPYFENVGVVTLEDVIEEILQSEIIDETDMMTDNRKKELRPRKNREYGSMVGHQDNRCKLPRQLGFVAFQYLATNIEPFSENIMSRNVLKNLLKKDIVVNVRATDTKDKHNYIYEKGVTTDKFVLILQGTVEVTIGEANMVFESGPFSHYGVEALTDLVTENTSRTKEYVPDFTVRVLTDVQYLFITQSHYLSAIHATRMMRQSGSTTLDFMPGSDVDRVRSSNHNNQNSGGVFTSHSPPLLPTNSPLDALRDDERDKKNSTHSLDRLAFFQRKPDPHEILNRMRRTGSDAKDRSADYYYFQSDPRKHSIDSSSHPADSPLSSPRKLFADGVSKRSPLSASQPFKAVSNHKLDFLLEDETGGRHGKEEEDDDHDRRKLVGKSPATAKEEVSPPAYSTLAEGETLPTAGANSTDPASSAGHQNKTGVKSSAAAEEHEMMLATGDSERAPLMQKDKEEPATASASSTTVNL